MLQKIKQQIQKQQTILQRLNQKHKKTLNLLSKCLDIDLTQLDKKITISISDMSNEKKGEKLKIATNKRVENQNQIDALTKQINLQEQQIEIIKANHKQKMIEFQQKKQKALTQMNKIEDKLKTLLNPNSKQETYYSSLFWKPQNKPFAQQLDHQNIIQSQQLSCLSRNANNSYKNITKKVLPNNFQAQRQPSTIDLKRSRKKIVNFQHRYERKYQMEINQQKAKQIQLQYEIYKLFKNVENQENEIQKLYQKYHQNLGIRLINQIGNRKQKLCLDQKLITAICKKKPEKSDQYNNICQDEQILQKFQRELQQRKQNAQTITTIKEI